MSLLTRPSLVLPSSSRRLQALKTKTARSLTINPFNEKPRFARARSRAPPPPVTNPPRFAHRAASSQGNGKLLQPYELSGRLIALCKRGDVDLAVSTLQCAPRNAQNIKVWNTLIQQCMDAKKYKLAYSVFTDMKRRGFVPNVRTYATMMSGYATVEDWGQFTQQLGSVHSVYAQLKQHLEKPRNLVDDPAGESGASFVLYPIALYISILGKARKYQRAFDVFHELDTDGPLAPHPKVYSSFLCVLADRVDSTDAEAEVTVQSVSDAKYVWRRHMRSLDRQPQHYIEPRSVDAMIKVLSRGEPSDHEFMFDILRDICGLPRPGEATPPPPPPKVAPNMWILSEALDSCIAAGYPDKAVHYAQSVMDTRSLRPILRPWHLQKLLRAHSLLAKEGSTSPARAENAAAWVEWMVAQADEENTATAPNVHTLASALELCYRCDDIVSALHIARTMLGGPMRGSMPAKAWVHLLRLAIVAPPGEKRRCLELLNTYSSVLDIWESALAIGRLRPAEKRAHVSLALCIVQVLRTAPSSLDQDGAELGQHEAWSDLRRRAESFLEKNHK